MMNEDVPGNMTMSGRQVFNLLFPTILYYLFAISIIFLGDKYMTSGPCTPGLGALAFLFAIPVSVFLFLRNIYLGIRKSKRYFFVATAHLIIQAIALVIMSLN